MNNKLTPMELTNLFLQDAESAIRDVVSQDKPLLIDFQAPINCRAKIYLFNCTNPPGGRSPDEYKVQLIIENQKRGQRGVLDESDGYMVFVIGYAIFLEDRNDGAYVIWETDKHRDFAYSANLQVALQTLLDTLYGEVVVKEKKTGEIVVAADRNNLVQAIRKRIEIDQNILLRE